MGAARACPPIVLQRQVMEILVCDLLDGRPMMSSTLQKGLSTHTICAAAAGQSAAAPRCGARGSAGSDRDEEDNDGEEREVRPLRHNLVLRGLQLLRAGGVSYPPGLAHHGRCERTLRVSVGYM